MNAIGANAWIWASPVTDDAIAALAPRVRDMGFDVLELPVEEPGAWDADRAAEVLAEAGLAASVCLVMPSGRELAAADGHAVRATQDYLRACIDVASTLGARAVCGPAYTSVGRVWRMSAAERSALYGDLREALRPVADYAAGHGVRVGVEPLVRYETSVVNTVEQALEIVGPLPAEGCGVLFDTYHANVEERGVASALRAAGERLVHVHACGNDRGAPGADDNVDWPAVAAALRDVRYDGPVVIESFTAENDVIATAASIWRPLARTQDALAGNGLEFLRRLLADDGKR